MHCGRCIYSVCFSSVVCAIRLQNQVSLFCCRIQRANCTSSVDCQLGILALRFHKVIPGSGQVFPPVLAIGVGAGLCSCIDNREITIIAISHYRNSPSKRKRTIVGNRLADSDIFVDCHGYTTINRRGAGCCERIKCVALAGLAGCPLRFLRGKHDVGRALQRPQTTTTAQVSSLVATTLCDKLQCLARTGNSVGDVCIVSFQTDLRICHQGQRAASKLDIIRKLNRTAELLTLSISRISPIFSIRFRAYDEVVGNSHICSCNLELSTVERSLGAIIFHAGTTSHDERAHAGQCAHLS